MNDDKLKAAHLKDSDGKVLELVDKAARERAEQNARQIQQTQQDTEAAIDQVKGEVENKLAQAQAAMNTKLDGAYVDENGMLCLTANGELVAGPFEVAGGGGGSANSAAIGLTNTTGWLAKTASMGADLIVTAQWSSTEDGVPTGDGAMKLTANGKAVITQNIPQGDISINLKPYLAAGSNTIKLTVTDVYGNSRTISYSINAIRLELTSRFDNSGAFTGPIQYIYTPTGSTAKTVHFILDDEEIGTQTVTASGRQQTFTIPAQSHGAHNLRVYFTAEIDGETVPSNELYHGLLCIAENGAAPVIASDTNITEAELYALINIEHRVYDPAALTAKVSYWVNGAMISEVTVDRTRQTFSYRPESAGALNIEIRCGSTVKPFALNITESDMRAEAETQDLSLYLTSYGRSNNEENPGTWISGETECAFAGFNFVSDGWQHDETGNTVLRVSGGARLTIPAQIFASDFRTTGKTIEIEFLARDVMNYDAIILSCMSGGRGIEITAQQARLTSEQSSIGTQYKEETPIRLSFVVEKRSGRRLMLIYLNGIMSGIRQYPTDDNFAQTEPADITIGSSECTIDLYTIRVYDNDLTRYQITDNWIADTPDTGIRADRDKANAVYDDYGKVTTDRLPAYTPYFIIRCDSWPKFKGDKKICSGSYTDPLHPERSFTFENAEIDVQGTSSQYYFIKNIKAKFKNGLIVDGSTMTVYAMKADSIPVGTFTLKTDVASSEGANNVVLAQLFNDTSPFVSPAKEADPRVRQAIDGMPVVIFRDLGDGPEFYAKANFNNDKGTPEIFGYKPGDEKWETLNNVSAYAMWQTAAGFDAHYTEAFEASYPEGNTDTTRLKALAQWISSTNRDKATGVEIEPVTFGETEYTHDTAECRLAKFRAQLSEHFDVGSCLHNYVFTETFLMVDSRTKNSFPTYIADLGRWTWPIYDADTAMGINNEGVLAFGYSLESGDKLPSGADVWNAAGNVFWLNLRDAFSGEIAEEYKRLRLTGLFGYEAVKARFDAHQGVWPAAIFNEDGYGKYIEPYDAEGATMYFDMALGKKELQRDWWLFNRFRYMDAKYDCGDAADDFILMRIYAEGELALTAYADTYLRSKMGSFTDEVRAVRGVEYTLPCRVDDANDLETTIYPASLISEIADLSPFKVGQLNLAKAVKLKRVKIGDASEGYSNGNLTSLTFGRNTLLKHIDVRNCPNLAAPIDVSGCTNIEELYFDGTAITGLALPNGGMVITVHYPATIKNLTVLNQRRITDFTLPAEAYAGIETLRIENSADIIPTAAILAAIPAQSRVRLIGIDWTMDDAEAVLALYDHLDAMKGLDEFGNNTDRAVVSGVLHIDALTGEQLAEMRARQPYIEIDYQHIASYCRFWNEDGTKLLYTAECIDGADAVYVGSTPSKTQTAQYTYSFLGWNTAMNATSADADALKNVTMDRDVYAAYKATVRTYTVYFYNGSTLLQTVNNVPYGGSATYTGSTPVYNGSGDAADYSFTVFSPTGKGITGNTSCYAQFKYSGYLYTQLIDGSITEYVDDEVLTVGEYAFYGCDSLKKVELKTAESVGEYAMSYCAALETVDLASVTNIGTYALYQSSKVNKIILRNEATACQIGSNAFFTSGSTNDRAYLYVPQSVRGQYPSAKSIYVKEIRAIEDYPEVWAKDSWASVQYHIEQGDYASFYAIGDLIPLDMGSEGKINMQIVAFDTDDLADGSGKAHISFVAKELLATKHRMNPARVTNDDGTYQEGTGSIGGWEKSEMRAYLNDTVLPMIPSDVQDMIKTVTKYSAGYDASNAIVANAATDDAVWIPNRAETGTGQQDESLSQVYNNIFNSERTRKKYLQLIATNWFLRTASGSTHFTYINQSGTTTASVSGSNMGVCLGFCV